MFQIPNTLLNLEKNLKDVGPHLNDTLYKHVFTVSNTYQSLACGSVSDSVMVLMYWEAGGCVEPALFDQGSMSLKEPLHKCTA